MINSIVVPLDGSPRAALAIEPAVALARRTGADLELVTVTSPGGDPFDDELLLKAACPQLEEVECRVRVLEGNDVATALAEATSAAGTILCMSTHGRTGLARAVLGSTAEAVVRSVTNPVLLIGPKASAPRSWEVVQACVDTTSAASRRVVPRALELADALGATLWLVEVQPPNPFVTRIDVVDGGQLAGLASSLRGEGLAVEWEEMHGNDVDEELLRAQRLLRAAVIVTSTHARGGIGRIALGSVTAAVVHKAPCPVLVLPPEDRT